MTTFDLAEVRDYAANLDARMNQCDNGEGMDCANLDGTLQHYAVLCFEFRRHVREWANAIFTGKTAFDLAVERIWLDEGVRLFRRASNLWTLGQEIQGECFEFEGGAVLGTALWRLERLLDRWVTPRPAIGPLTRQGVILSSADKEKVQSRIDALAPLPSDWQPIDPRQQTRLGKLQQRQSP